MPKKIVLVDDDALLRRSLAFNLERAGYQVQTSANAEDALGLARREPPDLILLDIGLPGLDGLDALKQFREQMGIAVILLTARRREFDQVLGLELGADDYVTKPFDLDVLLARVKAVLRRVQPAGGTALSTDSSPLVVGDLVIDMAAHTVTVADKPVELSPREFGLLAALASEAGHLVTTEDLLGQVWGAEYQGQPQVVYVHVRWLREKLEENPTEPRRIITVRGLGYKYQPVT
jgi:DNA-binding response OmpR family regulator